MNNRKQNIQPQLVTGPNFSEALWCSMNNSPATTASYDQFTLSITAVINEH